MRMFNPTSIFCNIKTWSLLTAFEPWQKPCRPLSQMKFGELKTWKNVQAERTQIFATRGGGSAITVILTLARRQQERGGLRWAVKQKGSGLYIAKNGCDIKHTPLLPLGQTWSLLLASLMQEEGWHPTAPRVSSETKFPQAVQGATARNKPGVFRSMPSSLFLIVMCSSANNSSGTIGSKLSRTEGKCHE